MFPPHQQQVKMVLFSFHQKVNFYPTRCSFSKYISPVYVLKDKVKPVGRLEGELESHEEGMLQALQ